MRILVHPSYQGELVNGEAASFSPYDPLDDATFYVNSQAEEILVTNPPPHSIPEEIELHEGGAVRVIGLSNQVPPDQLFMSKDQRAQLHSRAPPGPHPDSAVPWLPRMIPIRVGIDANAAARSARSLARAAAATTALSLLRFQAERRTQNSFPTWSVRAP